MIALAMILAALAFIFSLFTFLQSHQAKKQLQNIIGEDVDVHKLLKKLELHQLRQLDLKKRTDSLFVIQAKNEKLLDYSLKKVGLVRFNPYRDTGGDQSFSLCILDSNQDGFILTTIHGREGTRVYAKPIQQGTSEYDLSSEEAESLKKAII